MLININLGQPEDLKDVQLNHDCLNALHNIAMARREGKHIVIGPRKTVEFLGSYSSLSSNTQGIYRRIFSELTQIGSLSSVLPRMVEAVAGLPYPQVIENSNKKLIRIPLEFFSDSASVQKAVLLTENIEDTDLYLLMAEYYGRREQIGNIPIRYHPSGGGGDTTADNYKTFQDIEPCLCLCIVDSDLLAPQGKIGSTAKKVQDIDNNLLPHTELLMMHLREIENLIPTRVLSEIASGDRDRMPSILNLEDIENSSVPEVRNYLDFKEGIKLKKIFSYSQNTAEYKFWKSKLQHLNTLPTVAIEDKCLAVDQCMEIGACSCIIMRGLGPNILKQATEHLSKKSAEKREQSLCNFTKDEWLRIGGVVLSWCCGSQRLTAI